MSLIFREQDHTYWLNDKQLISVTQLLAKHELSVDYSDIPESILEKKREFGIHQHNELEMFNKGLITIDQVNSITKQGIELLQEKGIAPVLNEQRVHNNMVAGTIDLVGMENGEYVLVDYKFTSQLYTKAVMWQTNVYKRLIWEMHQIDIKRIYVLWYDKQNNLFKLRDLPILAESLIDKLFDLENKGMNYTKHAALGMEDFIEEFNVEELLFDIIDAKEYLKMLENRLDIIKQEMVAMMTKNGVGRYDSDTHRYTLIHGEFESKNYVRITRINVKSRAQVLKEIKRRQMAIKFKKKI